MKQRGFWFLGEMSPCHEAQPLWPPHFPFDLLHPPYHWHSQTFRRPVPCPFLHLIKQREDASSRGMLFPLWMLPVLWAFSSHTISLTSVFIFLPFSYLPGGGKEKNEKGRQAGTKDGTCGVLGWFAPKVLDCLTFCSVFLPLSPILIPLQRGRIMSRTVEHLRRWLSSLVQIMAKSNNFFGTDPRAIALTLYSPLLTMISQKMYSRNYSLVLQLLENKKRSAHKPLTTHNHSYNLDSAFLFIYNFHHIVLCLYSYKNKFSLWFYH